MLLFFQDGQEGERESGACWFVVVPETNGREKRPRNQEATERKTRQAVPKGSRLKRTVASRKRNAGAMNALPVGCLITWPMS